MEISASVLEDAATHLKRDGFAIVRGCLDAAWLRRLVDEYEARMQSLASNNLHITNPVGKVDRI